MFAGKHSAAVAASTAPVGGLAAVGGLAGEALRRRAMGSLSLSLARRYLIHTEVMKEPSLALCTLACRKRLAAALRRVNRRRST